MRFLAPGGNIVRGLLPALAARSMPSDVQPDGNNPFILLDGTWTQFYASRSRSLKKANNLATNRLGKTGAVRIEHIRAGDAQSCSQALAAAIDVSRRSWKQSTGNSLDQPGPNAFIQSLSQAAQRRGWLSLWLAYLDDFPVAMEFQLVFDGNVHALRADFDAAREEVSPGSYLFRHLLESLFGHGLACYFMGPGENAYKARWTDKGAPVCIADCYNWTTRGRLLRVWAVSLKPKLRRIRNALAGTRP
jgi:CelD/BcsL family acetyltransferase involved in cellulose biosynthesis